jgi:hypothetical protein
MPTNIEIGRLQLALLAILLLVAKAATAMQQQPAGFEGMWSDPPHSAVGEFCFAWCTDAGIDYLNKLLDDPANDARPFGELLAQATKYQADAYIKPLLTADALKAYPLDPADDPAFLRCQPIGGARQIFVRHQLDIRRRGKDRLEFHYGEWDATRTIYVDGRKRPPKEPPSRMGYSLGHWEGDALVIETSGFTPDRLESNIAVHSDQLRIVERYTRAPDGKTLMLTVTIEDPTILRAPLVFKKIWGWSPASHIDPYRDCQIPTEILKGTNRK